MEKNNPKVSILMGVYNCENTVSEAIDSIINQTYTNWELIICDDHSNDNTYKIVKEYEKKYHKKIKLIRNNSNLTLGPTLNKCLKLATGKYIARHDGDDLYQQDKLENQVDFLEKNHDIDLVGTGMRMFDENGFYGERLVKEKPVKEDLMRGSTFAHATIMAKKEVYILLNGYSEELSKKGVEDYELWFRFFEKSFSGYNIQTCLYNVREDRDAYKRKNIKRRINEINMMREGRKRLGLGIIYELAIIKPIIAIMIPNNLLMMYHKRKFKK